MFIPTLNTSINLQNNNYYKTIKNNNVLLLNKINFGNIQKFDSFELSQESSNDKNYYYDLIKNSIKKDNYINKGGEGRVFLIENDNNNVVKIPKRFFKGNKLDKSALKEGLIEEELTEQDSVNFIEKKFKNGVVIMKKISGRPASNIDEFKEIANLPVSAYQKLLNQIIDARSKDMDFDFAMNNVLYDKETGTLTAIDFRPGETGEFNPLERMYFAFDCFKRPYEEKISGKILCAALNNLKSDADPEKAKLDYDFNTIIKFLQYNKPSTWGIMENIKFSIDKIKFDRLFAETKYELSNVDSNINNVKRFIKHNLINESEQA